MKKYIFVFSIILLCSGIGCETVHEATKKGGEAIGKGANAVGGVSEGGAEAVQGPITDEENPFGR